ncbi:MAG TPA: hypothetical protein VIH76_04890 [Candidatus Acidoferrales bacterium]
MPYVVNPYSFAVFPFLKTSHPVNIAGLTLRSTDDDSGLKPEQAQQLKEITEMLFLQDDLRVRSASYCTVPFIELDLPQSRIEELGTLKDLERLQTLVAYCYAEPHAISGEPFLMYEHASLAIFSPGKVSIYIVRPDKVEFHHATHVGTETALTPDARQQVDGYAGIYNFKTFFWVTRGSRLYPPVSHIGLNLSQDLSHNLDEFFVYRGADYEPLLKSPRSQLGSTGERILTAMNWFNSATSYVVGEQGSIVNLAVAFETLLGLPQGESVTDRFVDSVALLLGRFPRLDMWVWQFYKARSEIVHQGSTARLKFVASDSRRISNGPEYHSLLTFGRQVFRLCVDTLLRGARLAENAKLEELLITKQERFQQICKVFSDQSSNLPDKFRRVSMLLSAIERYRFVPESDYGIEKVLAPTRLAAKSLLELDPVLDATLRSSLERLVAAPHRNHYETLDAIRELKEFSGAPEARIEADTPKGITLRLIRAVWDLTFWNYFSLKQQHERQDNQNKNSP